MAESIEEKNARLIKLGRSKFVLLHGVLFWGVPVGILFALIHGYVDGWKVLPVRLIEGLILFPLTGILVGRMTWKRMLRKQDQAVVSGVTRSL